MLSAQCGYFSNRNDRVLCCSESFSHSCQLENRLGGEETFQERVTGQLAPCIAQFSVAVADDALWKPLNYQILLKTRDSSPKVRRGGAHVPRAAGQPGRGAGRRTGGEPVGTRVVLSPRTGSRAVSPSRFRVLLTGYL